MTPHVVLCFAANANFVAKISRAYDRLSNKRNVDLRLVHVTDVESIRQSGDYDAQPLRFALFLTESEPPNIGVALQTIANVGVSHELWIFAPDSRFSPERINEILRMTPDPRRERKSFSYALKKEDRIRGIAISLTRACAKDRT